jgi:hypothetical protein
MVSGYSGAVSGLRRYDHYRGPEKLPDLWTLKRDQLTLRCTLSTHRLGWEVRVLTGTTTHRQQVCRSETEVQTVSEAWQSQARLQGWG